MLLKSKIKIGSNRSFGLVFFVVFLVISLWPLIYGDSIRIWSLIVSTFFIILGLMNSKLLTPLNQLWIKFGMILGAIISPVVMAVVFFLVVTPISFVMNIMGKDLLKTRYDKKKESYWIKRDQPIKTMKNQF